MSDNWIILFPRIPEYIPSEDARAKAKALMATLAPNADEVTDEAGTSVRFLDCGANLQSIYCPSCRAELDEDWWETAMEDDFDNALQTFRLGKHTLPCCGAQRPLNDLVLDWNQGFARYSLETMNPDIGQLSEADLSAFESILGCSVAIVYQHL